MRDSFRDALYEAMKESEDVIFITADLGFGVFDRIEQEFPERYINVGVAEQNMIGVATGLSLAGFRVLVYSIGNFSSLRCLEQIRNDACYHNCNITIVSSGAGFTYGQLGMSHHALEDAAVMRMIPNISVCSPSSPKAAYITTIEFLKTPSVKYLRLDKSSVEIYKDREYFVRGLNTIKNGENICIISHGSILNNVLLSVDLIKKHGLNPTVIDLSQLKPIDKDELISLLSSYEYAVTVEELSEIGGIGSAIADVVATNKNLKTKLLKIAIKNDFISDVGDQEYLRERAGLSPKTITSKIISFIKE